VPFHPSPLSQLQDLQYSLSSYPLFHSVHSCLICFCLTLVYHHAIDNHVVLFSSCSCIMCRPNLMFIRLLLPPKFRYLFLLRLFISEHLLYINPVPPSIQTNLIIMFPISYCILFISFLTPISSDL